MQYLSLGQKLRLKRKEFDLTLKDIAGDFISPATLSLVERDLQTPSEDLLRYLSDKLNTPLGYFRETPDEMLTRRAKTLLTEAEALMHRKRYNMAIRFAEEILQDAKELSLNNLVGQAAFLLARIALEQEDYHKANEGLFQAQSSSIQSGHLERLPNIYYHFALVAFRQGFFPQTLDYLKQAQQPGHNDHDDDLSHKILTLLSQTYYKLAQYDLALDYAEKAKALISRMNNLEAYAESLLMLGTAYREKEQYDLALDFFQEALRLSQQLNAKHELSSVEHHMATLYVKKGDLEQANVHFTRAVSQKQELGDPSVITASLDHVEAMIKADDPQAALKRLDEVRDLLDQFAAEEERARYFAIKYEVACMLGDEKASREALEEGLTLIRRLPIPKRLADQLVRMGRLSAKSGDQTTATILFAEALSAYETLGVIMLL